MPVSQPEGAIETVFSGAVADQKFAADGSLLIASGSSVLRVDATSGAVLDQYDFASPIGVFDLSADGRYLVAASSQSGSAPAFYRVDLQTGAISAYALSGWPSAQASIGDVAMLDDGSALFIAKTIKSTLLRFDFDSGSSVVASTDNLTGTLVPSADRDTVFVIGQDVGKTSYVYTSASGITQTHVAVPDPYAGASTRDIGLLLPVGAISPDESRFVYGSLQISDNQLQPLTPIASPLEAYGLAYSPSGDLLYAVLSKSVIAAIDTSTNQLVATYPLGGSVSFGSGDNFRLHGDLLQVSDDGRYLAVITTAGVQRIDLTLVVPISDASDNVIDEGGGQLGLAGDDTLGSAGPQFMAGGQGDDTYHLDVMIDGPRGDVIVEAASEGHDTILASVSFVAAPNNVEDLIFVGSGGATLIGNADANTITGGDAADRIYGSLGADALYGGAGNDILASHGAAGPFFYSVADVNADSGLEHDALFGGEGDDALHIGFGDDADGGAGADTLHVSFNGQTAGLDFDTAALAAAIAGGQPFELNGGTIQGIEALAGLVGTEFDDTIIISTPGTISVDGSWGNDTLLANGGPVFFNGGAGDDWFVSGPYGDTFNGGDGVDTVDYRNATSGVTVTVGPNNGLHWPGHGGDQLLSVEQVVGSAFDDLLTGGDGNDRLHGRGGNDTLIAGYGEDTLRGGDGFDVLYFGSRLWYGDLADGGSGTDVLVLQGHYYYHDFSATNMVGIESISLRSGEDTRWGDTANNFYDYDLTPHDANVAAGQQMIVNGQSLRAGEDFAFDGSAESDGRFLVYAGHGIDTLVGGDGNDVFFFEGPRWNTGDSVDGGAGRDAVILSAGSGINRYELTGAEFTSIESISVNSRFASDPSQVPSYELVLADGTVALGATLVVNANSLAAGQTLALDGSAVMGGNLQAFGGAGDDILIGGAQQDVLYGGDGTDALTGGGGIDLFRFDAASHSASGAADAVLDFTAGDLIDLSRIDSNTSAGAIGDQGFYSIGTAAFTGTGEGSAGQLRYESTGGASWLVQADTDGDGLANFELYLTTTDAHPLTASDFLM